MGRRHDHPDMLDRLGDRPLEVASLCVLGAGFLAMALGVSRFWLVWVIGYAVVVPLLSVLLDDEDTTEGDGNGEDDPVAELRERYARGELTDAEFERRLERLLEPEAFESDRPSIDVPDREADSEQSAR